MSRIDQFMFDFLNLAQGPLASDVLINWMSLITELGSGFVLILVAALTCICLAERKAYRRAVLWFVAVSAVFFLTAFLKQLFDAPRPDAVFHLTFVSSPSFPSGHTLRSTFIYPGVVIALRSVYRFPARLFMTLAIILAGAIGMSRIMLGVHWPLDVFAGWAIGAGAVIFWSALNSSAASRQVN